MPHFQMRTRKNYDITRFDRKASGSNDNFEKIECPFKLVCQHFDTRNKSFQNALF